MERRTFDTNKMEIRAKDDGSQTIGGYAVVFDRLSVLMYGFRERIKPGAFESSMGDDIRALWQHDTAQVLGRTKAGSLRIWEDETGVGFEVDPPDTQTGRDAVTLIGRGDVDQMSFGFSVLPDGDEWIEEEDGQLVREVRHAKLYEVSPVTFPAYPDSTAEIVRSAPEWVQRALTQGANDSSNVDEARARLALRRKEIELLELGG
jgi:HK97 family phage prohead protease